MLQKFGLGELAMLLIIAFLVFGPSKVPQLGKSIGEGIWELKYSFRSVSGDDAKSEGKGNDQSDRCIHSYHDCFLHVTVL